MFDKDKSVEDYVAKNIRPAAQEEAKIEEKPAIPIVKKKQRKIQRQEEKKF